MFRLAPVLKIFLSSFVCVAAILLNYLVARLILHGVQRRTISVVNFFVFLRLLFCALLLLYVTLCTMMKLYFTILMC